jgi:hypothetical protein
MLVGLVTNAVPVSRAALALIIVYGAYYGLIETAGRPGLPPPGRTWQVPSQWVDGAPRWRRTLVWGSLLGPGFATRNPYAGFGLLLLAVAAIGNLRLGVMVAAALGLLHALGRAAALLRDTARLGGRGGGETGDYLQSVIRTLRWRMLDGLAMLAVAGMATVMIAGHG